MKFENIENAINLKREHNRIGEKIKELSETDISEAYIKIQMPYLHISVENQNCVKEIIENIVKVLSKRKDEIIKEIEELE